MELTQLHQSNMFIEEETTEPPNYPTREIAIFDVNNKIKEHNLLVNARYTMTINEQVILHSVISTIRREDTDFFTYRFSLFDIGDKRNIARKNVVRDLTTALDKLINRDVIIQRMKTDPNSNITPYFRTKWITSYEIYEDGTAEITFHPKLKPYLLNLQSHFTEWKYKYILTFSGQYTARIYGLIIQHQNAPYNFLKVNIDDLKYKLKLDTYVDPDTRKTVPEKYKNFSDFERFVLEPSVKEINEFTEVDLHWTPGEKIRKKVVSIVFRWTFKNQKKENMPLGDDQLTDEQQELVAQLIAKNISPIKAVEFAKAKPADYILKTIAYCEKKSAKTPEGFLVSALEQGWAYEAVLLYEKRQADKFAKEQIRIAEKTAAAAADRQREEEIDEEVTQRNQIMDSLTDDELDRYESNFLLAKDTTPFAREYYLKNKDQRRRNITFGRYVIAAREETVS